MPELVDNVLCCFYLSKRRQMQPNMKAINIDWVVFTFQKEGRCNFLVKIKDTVYVVFTFQKEGRCNCHRYDRGEDLVVFTFQKEGRCNGYLVNDSFPICFLCFLGYTSSLFIY